jgi:hypothetical protein
MSQSTTPDLTQRAPRSGRVKLGGFVILPRMLDKGRATLGGKNGEYHYDCPMDQRFTEFAGIDAEALKKELAAGKGDGEILEWIKANSKNKPSEAEIAVWSTLAAHRAPMDVESRQFFTELQGKVAPKREDVGTWFDLLDIDDFVTFGGKA